MTSKQPRVFEKDGRRVEITGPTTKCLVWIDGKLVLGRTYFRSLQAARRAAFGPDGWITRHKS